MISTGLESLLDGEALNLALDDIAHQAARAFVGVDAAAAVLHRGPDLVRASTDPLAVTVDDAQYGLGQGPCLHAFRTGRAVLLDMGGDDTRWPDFQVAAVEAGAQTALSVPMRLDDDTIGSLNFYSRTRGAFSADAARQAELFARPSALRLSHLGLAVHAVEASEVVGLELQDRDTIEQALGVLMGVHRDGSVRRARRRLQHTATELGVGVPQAAARLVDGARTRGA